MVYFTYEFTPKDIGIRNGKLLEIAKKMKEIRNDKELTKKEKEKKLEELEVYKNKIEKGDGIRVLTTVETKKVVDKIIVEVKLSDEVFKLSEYFENKYESDPDAKITPLECSDVSFEIFRQWFNSILVRGVVNNDNFSVVYRPESTFEHSKIEELVDLFNFALSNQIKLLKDTVSFVLATKTFKIIDKRIAFKHTFGDDFFKTSETLTNAILKNMLDEKFYKLPLGFRNNIKRNVVLPYAPFKIQKDYIWKNDSFRNYTTCIIPYDSKLPEEQYGVNRVLRKVVVPASIEINKTLFANCPLVYLIHGFTLVKVPKEIEELETDHEGKIYRVPFYIDRIEEQAFEGCDVEQVILPKDIKEIGSRAFARCENLKEIVIPETTVVAKDAFIGCYKLNLVHNEILLSIADTITAFTGRLMNSDITEIANHAIENRTNLKTVNLYKTKIIGSHAFKDCINLTEVILSDTVETIGREAFSGCYNLKKINIPDSVKVIETLAFDKCSNLKSICINSANVGTYVFKDCKKLKSVKLGACIEIPFGLFKNCYELTEVVLAEKTVSIGNSAFDNCSKLEKIKIPSSVNHIAENAFGHCYALTEITIPKHITTIEKETFSNCSGLKTVNIKGDLLSIGDYAFEKCTSLAKINLPMSLTEVSSTAFASCDLPEEILKSIGKLHISGTLDEFCQESSANDTLY